MNIKALDSLLSQVVEAVIPRLIKKQMKPGDGVTKDEFEQIFYRLLLSTDIDTANKLIKQFNQYLISVGAVKYDENPGISIVRIKRPAARITVDGVHDLRWLSSLETLFLSSLDVLSSDLEKRTGQLIFSAIRYGGLLRSAQIKLFMNLICEPPHYLDGHIWFEIEENNNEGTQIWNPDPLTLALLYNWYEDLMHIKLKDALKEKRTVFQWIHIINRFFNQDKKKTKKISPKKLIKAISSRLSLSMPALLVDCAQGVHDSRTIHPDVYCRLITAKSPVHNIDCIEPPQQQSTRQKTIQKINTAHKSGLKDNELLLKIGQLLRSVNKRGQIAKEIKDLIDTLSPECNPITVYLCQWISIRLTHNNRWGNRYKAKSAYTRLRSIARRLGGWMGSEDPTKMGVQKLIEIYEEVIDSVDTISLRASIAKNLREFQEFLEDEWGAERITSDAPWAGYNKGGSNVDAKIILPEEYATATNFYFKQIEKEHNSLEKNLLIARLLLLIMGYRAGMRRKEGIGLRIKDICSMGRPEILIRPHEKRLLKSLSANRRIPVFIFFSTNEQALLLSFLKKREEEGAKPDDYFFCIRELQTPFINESLVFDHIQWLLQVITGDPKTRYHHLRHSFATWRFWKWMMPRYYEYETLYRGFEQYDEQKLLNERKNVLGLQNGDEASHKVAYALSMSVGHSGPSMTLNHYIHSDHWMREIEFRRLSPQLSTKTISSLAGVSVRAVQKKAKGKKDGLTADL
ncbi:MAG TPA: site-specific integrase, partial [Aeromonadales bacterium]|nr:site-specific integrase [Aeromonadales bacterium]